MAPLGKWINSKCKLPPIYKRASGLPLILKTPIKDKKMQNSEKSAKNILCNSKVTYIFV